MSIDMFDNRTFQLTPSRRATFVPYLRFIKSFHFNSRPHGGRQCFLVLFLTHQHFNSRPHGGRLGAGMFLLALAAFQLTPSRRATQSNNEHDWIFHFNSRPHGGRRFVGTVLVTCLLFQLTPSRRATARFRIYFRFSFISTHALTEGDGYRDPTADRAIRFQLTPSRRATTTFRF